MAEVNLFHFQEGKTTLHKLDTKFKLLLLLAYSALIYRFEPIAMMVLSLIIIIFFFHTIPSPSRLIREMKVLFFILILIFVGALLSTQGEIFFKPIPILTKEGLTIGSLAAWKFLMVILVGLIFSATTTPEQIHIAVYQIIKPLPLINEISIASKLSLTIMFIPVVLDMMNEVMEARKSRYVEGSRNPIKNIISLVVPITSGVITRADETSMALESRLYNGEPVTEKNSIKKWDCLIFILGVTPIIAAIIVQIIDKNT